MNDLTKEQFFSSNYMEDLVEQAKNIDTTNLSNRVSKKIQQKVEEQKVYFWIRLYLKDENPNIEIGDDITITWTPTEEKLTTKFICYGKTGLKRDHENVIINYNGEDDKKVLCLMVDEGQVNYNEDIPFVRTLFKVGRHYEYQLVKRSELLFVVDRNNVILDYFDCDF
jgi:polyhydroxyalkanoate synthesis regulator phasin